MTGHGVFLAAEEHQRLWYNVLTEKTKEIAEVRAGTILDWGGIAEAGLSLHDLKCRYSSTTSARCLDKLNPTLERLQGFSAIINGLVQCGPSFTSLIWGALLTVIDLSNEFQERLEEIVDELDQLTKAISRINRYADLYRSHSSLQPYLRAVYSAYIDFCLFSVRFFQKNPFSHVLMLPRCPTAKKVKAFVVQIDEILEDFKEEVQLAFHTDFKQLGQVILRGDLGAGIKFRAKCLFVPFARNERFYGRLKELEYLQENLTPSAKSQRLCVIHGIGGQGKTQLALEFAYRSQMVYSHIFWIRAQDGLNLEKSFEGAFDRLFVTQDDTKAQVKVQELQHWLRDSKCGLEFARMTLSDHEDRGWLLIFDNVDYGPNLDQYWPNCSHGSIILTTQESGLVHRTRSSLLLESFDPEEGSQLLIKQLKPRNPTHEALNAGKKLSYKVGGLPLTLVRLAGHIEESQSSVAKILDEFRTAKISYAAKIVFEEKPNSTTFQYERPLKMAFGMAMSKLPDVAVEALNVMAMVSPDAIPERMFFKDQSNYPTDSLRFDKDIRKRLAARHLIEIEAQSLDNETYISLHRSLKLALLDDLTRDPRKLQGAFDQTVALLRRELPAPSECMVPINGHWSVYSKMSSHVLELHKVYSESQSCLNAGEEFVELLYGAGTHLYERSLYESGKLVLDTAKTICEALESPFQENSHILQERTPNIQALKANILTVLWGICLNQGGLTTRHEAHVNMKKVVEFREAHRKTVSPNQRTISDLLLFANMRNDKACQLIDEEQYDLAEPHLIESLKIKDGLSLAGENVPPFEFAESKKNLAIVRMSQGLVDDAIELSRVAVAHLEAEADQQSWSYELCRFTLASMLFNAGNHREALDLHRKVHEARCALYGRLGHATLHSCFSIALAEYKLENLAAAREILKSCLGDPMTTPVNQWPIECSIRAIYLQSHILEAFGEAEAVSELRQYALAEKDRILANHTKGLQVSLPPAAEGDMSQMIIFDHLVNSEAGRSTIGKLRICQWD